MAEVEVEQKGNNVFKYIVLFIVFLGIGAVAGFFGTKKYLASKQNDEDTPVIDSGPEDITNLEEYSELINKLHAVVDGYSIFYSTSGISVAKMSNDTRLAYIYDYLDKNGKIVDDSLIANYGADNCINQFALDDSSNLYRNSNSCSIRKVERNLFNEANSSFFNDELIDTSVNFTNSNGKLCFVSEGNYLCGNAIGNDNISGKLESKFSIVKVTKEDGTIVIYDKGYLVDTRSNVVNPDDGYDNYYLHSADSTSYYYELKNADNLTFKHTFETKDRINYYYVSSELVKE